MASLLRFAYVMAIGRAVSGWRLEAVLFGGIMLAVALMASGVIFSELLSNAALRDALGRSELEKVNFTVRSFSSRDDPPSVEGRSAAFRARDNYVRQYVQEPFQPYLKNQKRLIKTATFYFQGRPQLEVDQESRPRGPVVHLTGMDGRVRVLEGQWPTGPGTSGAAVEIAVDRLGSELLGMGVGDVMEIFPASLFEDSLPMKVRIAAIFEVLDPSDEFWYGLSATSSKKDERWTLVPLFASEEALLSEVLGSYPAIYADTTWHFHPDPERMPASEVEEIQRLLAQIERSVTVGLSNSSYRIRLDSLLRDFEQELLLGRLPLLLLLFLVVAILTYYLALIAGLIVRSRKTEISLLKSRGATSIQIAVLGLGEGLIVATPAVIAGPYAALGLIKLLGFVFFRLSGVSGEPVGATVGISLPAFLLGLAGGVLAVLVFTVATLVASRQGGVEVRQSSARPPTSSILHRYYLDVALLALIGLVWWQLQSRGAFLVQSLGSRELSIDYSLLLGPVLGLAAAGLIVLRAFPWFTAALARIAGPVAPSWLLHVLRHLSRDPLTPAMLIVLVMFATALGVMGSAFSATLERGQRDQALYEAGADLRLRHTNLEETSGMAATVVGLEGIEAAADVFRTSSFLTTSGFSTSSALLAVQADAIGDTAWLREDFADALSADDLSGVLRSDGPAPGPQPDPDGLELPPDATALTLWARASGSSPFLEVWVRLKDTRGRIIDARIGDLDRPGWTSLSLPLYGEALGGNQPGSGTQPLELRPPFRLMSIFVRGRYRASEGGAVFFGRVNATTPRGESLVHDFSSIDGWHVIEDFRKPGLYSLETSGSAAEGEFLITTRYSFGAGRTGLAGIGAGSPEVPIPALVSTRFREIADAKIGDRVILGLSNYSILLEVAGELEFFPTLDPAEKPFVVVDISRFNQSAIRHSPRPPTGPNELWISGVGGSVDVEAVSSALRDAGVSIRSVHHAPTLVAARLDQPLVNAGWGGLLVLLFLAIAIASASGLLLFSRLDARERQTEFAMLRTLGISRAQMSSILWAGLLIVVVCGVGLGTLLGWLLGASLLPLMEVAEAGKRITPSLVFTTDWQRLLVSYVILGVITLFCGLWLTWLTARLQLHQVLRLGE